MTEIFKKLLLKKETPFLSKIVHFRHKKAWISEKRYIHKNPETRVFIICHKEVTTAVLAKSRTRTPDHLLVSRQKRINIPCSHDNITSKWCFLFVREAFPGFRRLTRRVSGIRITDSAETLASIFGYINMKKATISDANTQKNESSGHF